MTDHLLVNAEISLTPFQPGDQPNLVRYLNDAEIYRNTLRIPNPYTEQDADEWLVFVRGRRAHLGCESHWAIRHRDAGYIGGISCFYKTGPGGHLDEIGYALGAPFRGRGLMTEIVMAFTRWQFEYRPALMRLEAYVFAYNPASGRVLQKAGYEREGYLRHLHYKDDQLIDAVLWAKIRNSP